MRKRDREPPAESDSLSRFAFLDDAPARLPPPRAAFLAVSAGAAPTVGPAGPGRHLPRPRRGPGALRLFDLRLLAVLYHIARYVWAGRAALLGFRRVPPTLLLRARVPRWALSGAI